MSTKKLDTELEQYRNLISVSPDVKDGFGWTTVAGILFCGLVMLPGSIYLSLMTGGNMGAAGTWVTVILFAQIAKRALKTMSKQELVVLLYAAGIMAATGGPFGEIVKRAFIVTSDAARDAGITHIFPTWWAPKPDSPAILERNLFHKDWLVPILMAVFMIVVGFLQKYSLGYVLFRITSDVEKLPFPLAPINAQGSLAMAEMDVKDEDQTVALKAGAVAKRGGSKRWKQFSFGVTMGVLFGIIQVGIPAITGLFLDKPVFLIPQPFLDLTALTERVLPATPTGMALDLGIVLGGMMLPFWAVMGTFSAIALTMVANPVLQKTGVLTHWQPGMDVVNTAFSNNMDFWLSFGLGASLGIAVVSIFEMARGIRATMKERRKAHAAREAEAAATGSLWTPPRAGRGDFPMWVAVLGYLVPSAAVTAVCYYLVPTIPLGFLLVIAFLYSPFIAYVNARLLGIAGQAIDIPFIRESAFMLSGAKGVDIWLAPIPLNNYGHMAQAFRVNELTGVSFRSLMKAELVATPILFILSLLFWSFIWKSGPIPSEAYPFTQVTWVLESKNSVLLWSSTVDTASDEKDAEAPKRSILESQFFKQAIHPKIIGSGFATTVVAFTLINLLGWPILLVYGFIRGLGGLPHTMFLEIVGALVGRFYFRKKFGTGDFLRTLPIIIAGYFTGVGLISMATIAMSLIQQAVSGTPF